MTCLYRGVVAAILAVLCLAGPALAQSGSQRPYRGLFGGHGTSTTDQTLDLTLSLAEAYDDNLLAETGGVGAETPIVSGFYTMVLTDAAYEWRGRRSQVAITGGTAVRYYNDTGTVDGSYTGGVGFSTELAKRTRFFANQTVAYSPSYLYGLFPSVVPPAPGDAIPVAPDYAVNDSASYSYRTSASISRGVTRRGDLSFSLDYQYTDFLKQLENRRDLSAYSARVQFARGMSRNASLKVGYRFRGGEFGYALVQDGKTTEHGFDIGIDYTRPLSPTRNLNFAFSLGSSATALPPLVEVVRGDELQYTVLGDVSFGYQFRRNWETRASYRRGLEYVPELSAPVYTDGFSATINGLFTDRMDFSGGAGYSTGASALVRSAAAFDTYTATARVRHALAKAWAVYFEYFYYYYDFGRAQLPLGVPPTMERNGVRVGITVWVPVLRR